MSIRVRVIFPYLLLTLVVAITGAYVVTKLVTNSLTERLNNQLLEAGHVVSDSFVRQENNHIEQARVIVFTRGVAEALREKDSDTLASLVTPTAGGIGVENIIIVDMQGQEMLHLHRQADGALLDVTQPSQNTQSHSVQALLDDPNPNNPPTRMISRDESNDRWYYFTALPFVIDDEMIGVIVVGTPMETIMPLLKSTALADIIIYGENGQAIASTFQSQGDQKEIFLQTLSIPSGTYQEVVAADELVFGQNIPIEDRSYSLARGKLKVSDDLLGVFAVVLSSDYVVQTSAVNRNLYTVIFSLAMIVVVLLGFIIARRIIDPLSSLVQTSQAISDGDLTQRTNIRSKDEIGTLATTFDKMTSNLQERTDELERTNKILEQMDKTKSSFISISAHELRTPLTLIQGYAYMLQQTAEKGSDLETLSNGLMDGFDRMEEVVNSMLDVSKIDTQLLQLSKSKTKLNVVVSKVHKYFKSALEERKLHFTVENLDTLPIIQADSEMLYKVFYQVLMNSIKFTPDNGRIHVKGRVVEQTTSNGPEVEIAISDTGIGIAPQNHELVFEKFYQTGEVLLHTSSKTKFKGGGPGLGLAIARGIVDAHGGRIWLVSPGYDEETNPGTTVYIQLPVNG